MRLIITCLIAAASVATIAAAAVPSHPRLILTDSRVSEIKAQLASSDDAKALFSAVKSSGESLLGKPPVARPQAAYSGILDAARKVLDRLYTLTLLARVTNNQTFADRAVLEMLNCTAWEPDWNPASHFLDTAELMHGVGMAYDAIFDSISESNRSRIAAGLATKGLGAYQKFHPSAWWYTTQTNWGGVCNGGAIVAALALEDDPVHGSAAADVLSAALDGIPHAMSSYGPDGLWPEGPTYEAYMSRYAIAAVESLLNGGRADEARSLMASAGFNVTCLTTITQQGMSSQQFFDWSDSSTGPEAHPNLFWFARRFNQPACAYIARAQAANERPLGDRSAGAGPARLGTDVNSVARNLLYFTPAGSADDLSAVPRDAVYSLPTDFPHTGTATGATASPPAPMVAMFHREMNDSNLAHGRTAMLGFKAGYNGANHGHLDAGSFVFDSTAVRVAGDLGAGFYGLPDYFGGKRWDYFRTNSSGHNVLRFGGRNQNTPVVTSFVKSYGVYKGPWQVADLTPAYKGHGVTSVLRGASMVQDRTEALVVDNIVATSDEPVVWQMNTPLTNVTGPHVAPNTGNTYFELTRVMGGGGRVVKAYVSLSKRNTACEGIVARAPYTPQLEAPQKPFEGVRLEFAAPSAAKCSTIVVVIGPVPPSLPWDVVTDVTQWADKSPIHMNA